MSAQLSSPSDVEVFRQKIRYESKMGVSNLDPATEESYVPIGALRSYLTVEVIRNLLTSVALDYTIQQCRTIRHDYIIVFSILAFIGQLASLPQFLGNYDKLSDRNLPFTQSTDWGHACLSFFERFSKVQWMLCASSLQRLDGISIDNRRILPIEIRSVLKHGPDSYTYLIWVHPDYNRLVEQNDRGGPRTNEFVLKTCQAKHAVYHHREVTAYRALELLEGVSRYLAQFYGSWTQNGKFCKLLEYVRGGNLTKFLETENPPNQIEDIRKFWISLSGIIKILVTIHALNTTKDDKKVNLQGIHPDIKPDNILVTECTGDSRFDIAFKLADLGVTDFEQVKEQDKVAPRRDRDDSGTQMFSPPEHFKPEADKFLLSTVFEAKPSKDIWSLACVLSEIAVWAGLGRDRLANYRKDRKIATDQIPEMRDTAYHGCFHNGAEVLKTVLSTHDEILDSVRIIDKVIPSVVVLVNDMFGEQTSRPNAREVYNRFQRALEQAERLWWMGHSKKDDTDLPPFLRRVDDTYEARRLPPEIPADVARLGIGTTRSPSLSIFSSTGFHGNIESTPVSPIMQPHVSSPERRRTYSVRPARSPLTDTSVAPSTPGTPSIAITNGLRGGFLPRKHVRYHSMDTELTSGGSETLVQRQQNAKSSVDGSPTLSNQSFRRSPRAQQNAGFINPNIHPVSSMIPVLTSNSEKRQKALPEATITMVERWISRKKVKSKSNDLPGSEWLKRLNKRDQIFIIDDSSSMEGYWTDVVRAFSALSYLVKHADPDEMEVRLTNDPSIVRRQKHRKRLANFLGSVDLGGQCDIGRTLGMVLDNLQAQHNQDTALRAPFSRRKAVGTDIYVLTDGIWQDGGDWLHPIVTVLKSLEKSGTRKGDLGIQFIRFGHNPEGISRLEDLDDKLEKHGLTQDFIDTEPFDGNIYKMLLGATDPSWDSYKPNPSSTKDATRHLNDQDEQVPMDSDYGSGTYGKSVQTYSSAGTELEVITEDTEYTEYTHEDSVFVKSQSPAEKQDVQNPGLYTADTIYSASETATLPPLRDKGYIDDLAADLFSTVKSYESNRETLERISEVLLDLLRAFALKLGHKAQTPMHRDVSFFVHKNRGRIKASFDDMFPIQDVSPSKLDRTQPGDFAIGRYMDEPIIDLEPVPENQDDLDLELASRIPDKNDDTLENDTLEDDTLSILDAGPYRDFIVTTPAYSWLVASVQREARLTRANPDVMEDIREKILGSLPSSHRVTRRAPSQEYKATFELDWDPLSFVREQRYSEDPDEALQRAITLTGSLNDAQAATAVEYFSQTWPATGKHVMRLIADVVHDAADHHIISSLPDGTELDARIEKFKFIVTTVGTGDSVAEIGQQFAWLGATLRSSRYETGVATCLPLLHNIRTNNPPLAQGYRSLPEIHCSISFELSEPALSGEKPPGHCWHDMFRNPVVVRGFPIPCRTIPDTGLEVSLHIMAGLAQSPRATVFNRQLYIKGFSTLLVPTAYVGNIIKWHLLYNEDGSYISYLDKRAQELRTIGSKQINFLDLESSRHILGWCRRVQNHAGAHDTKYCIRPSGRPEPHAGCNLEKFSITGGKFINIGASFAIGMKDIPLHLKRNGSYIEQIKDISSKFVVFYDVDDKRAWLVNGASALLHLVRASLEDDRMSNIGSKLLFQPANLRRATFEFTADSAVEVLVDEQNMELQIFAHKRDISEEITSGAFDRPDRASKIRKTHVLFQDRVEQVYHFLEQVLTYQTDRPAKPGVELKYKPRNYVEGFDFMDVATGADPVLLRITGLQSTGKCWIDFTRAINAVTLFGRGFGEIICSREDSTTCDPWTHMPIGLDHLAVCVSDLKTVIRKWGDLEGTPIRVANDIFWHKPDKLFESCLCKGNPHKDTCDRAQVLLPSRFNSRRLANHVVNPGSWEDKDQGAIIFGHSRKLPVHWPDQSNKGPEEAIPETVIDDGQEAGVENLPSVDLSAPSGSVKSTSSNSRLRRTDLSSDLIGPASTQPSSNQASSHGNPSHITIPDSVEQ